MSNSGGHSKARIGILGNNENTYGTCDSRIGFGTGGFKDDSNTRGNEATWYSDRGDRHIKAMGYILVQWALKLAKDVNLKLQMIFRNQIQKLFIILVRELIH